MTRVEVYSKNKFEKLLHLVGFIIRIYHDARSPERQIHQYTFVIVSHSVLVTMRNISDQGVEKIKTHFMFHNFFFSPENHVVYEVMWRYMIEPDRPVIKVWRMHLTCWINKFADAVPKYVILFLFTFVLCILILS